jgi:acyl-CoA dehydrogenase
VTYAAELRAEIDADGGGIARTIENMARLGPLADEIGDLPDQLFEGVDVRRLNCCYLPPELGGLEVLQGAVARCVLSEMIGYADPAIAIALPGPSLIMSPLLQLGSEHQRIEYLGRFNSEKPVWGAFAMTEPKGGSDATQLATSARPCDGGYVLNGEKCFIGNGGRASFFVVYATTDPDRGQFGIQPFLVDADTPGLRVEDAEPMLGLRAVRAANLYFDQCRLPSEALLGSADGRAGASAFLSAQRSWEYMRPGLSALIVGALRRLLDDLERLTGEGDDGLRQAVAAIVSRVRPQAESVRLLSHHAAAQFDAGKESAVISSMAKAAAANLARDAVGDALLAVGERGLGESRIGREVGRWARDFQAFELLEGTTEVHRLMIARAWSVRSRRSRNRQVKAASQAGADKDGGRVRAPG